MRAKEITVKNILANGFRVGKAVKGKGHELYKAPYYFVRSWSLSNNDEEKISIINKISSTGIKNLFVKEIRYIDGPGRYFQFENKEQSQSQIDIQELIDKKFEGVSEITIYYAPDKLLGYFPISKYTSDLDSQKEMMIDLLMMENKELFEEKLYDYEDEWVYDTELMSFSNSDSNGNYYSGDYELVHGNSYYMDNREECDYINGRVKYYNSTVLDNFWNFDYEECLKPHLEELDPEDKVCVYHRKGKDWYVGYQYDSEQIILSYRNEEGEIVDEEDFYILYYKKDTELIKKFSKIIKSWRDNLSAESYIYNKLEIGEDYSYYPSDVIVNRTLVELIYEDKNDLKNEIIDNVTSWDLETIKEEFIKAYHTAISSRVKVLEDLTVQITTVPIQVVTNLNKPKTITFNHLKFIKRLEKRYEYKLVQTSIFDSSNKVQWAIKQGEEEYHFYILDVITQDINGVQSLKEFIVHVLEALEKRKLEKIPQKEFLEKATRVFVSVEDSIKSGNCQYGTTQFLLKHHIDSQKIGGIRGDALLELENSDFTRRAVNHAIIRHDDLIKNHKFL
jgi:hypothetical protein